MKEKLTINEPAEVKAPGVTVLGVKPLKIPLGEFTRKATLVKSSSRYEVYDLSLENLVVSMTILYEGESTVGHSHNATEEAYLFVEGKGEIELDGRKRENVANGDIITIPHGAFHRVFNTGKGNLKFICIFEKYQSRER